MEGYEGYQDPPRTNLFFNPVPSEGFKLVRMGSQVPLGDVLPIAGESHGEYLIAMERGKNYTFREVEKSKEWLLLQVGRIDQEINVFHDFYNTDGKPIFQQFSDLETDEKILQFACKFGQLIHGVKTDIISGQVFLEPFRLWKNEISLVRQTLKIWSSLKAGDQVNHFLKPHPEKDKVLFLVNGDTASASVPLPSVLNESIPDTVKRGLGRFIDQKMFEYPATVAHGYENRKIRGGETVRVDKSFIRPTSLISAIWLQISQSFFLDGENKIIARRCFLTGDFFAESAMRRRNAEPFKGQYYSINGMRNFLRQKSRRIEAALAGKEVKPDREGATRFLVDFDSIGEPVAEIAKKKTHPKK